MSNKDTLLEYAEKNSNESVEELYNKINNNFDGVVITLWIFCGVSVLIFT